VSVRDTGSEGKRKIRRLSLRETMETYKRFAVAFANDPRRKLCGVVCNAGPNGEPLACAYEPDHRGDHSWATLPSKAAAS
jgi:hypothetical protein